jgi:aminoglycoside 3-N-acetyltransferase
MFESIRQGRSRYGLRKYLKRRWRLYFEKFLRPIDRKKLLRAFKDLGIREGDLICVHSRFSALGYVKGGPETFIAALQDSVGPDGTIMMPTFSMSGSMLSYVESGEVFDVRSTPSKVGLLTEMFRTSPGVVRSLHPTNSVAAKGPLALEIVRGHEKSSTPYGNHTPYDRLKSFNGKILMVNTHVHSFLHHIQEAVDFPNLYLEKPAEVTGVGEDGEKYYTRTSIMRPRIPYWLILDGTDGDENDYAILHDYALIFPQSREAMLKQAGYKLHHHENIWKRRETLTRAGTLKSKKLGGAMLGLLDAAGFFNSITPEFKSVLSKHRNKYRPEILAKLNLPYF